MLQRFKLLNYVYPRCYYYYDFKKTQIFGVYKEKENNGFPGEYHACATSKTTSAVWLCSIQPTEVSAHDSLVYHCDIYQQGQLQREDGPLRQVMD